MIVKLTIKSIIRFEQLTNKSFYSINYNDVDDLIRLMYCIVITNNPPNICTIDDFTELINTNSKIAKELFDKFNLIIKLIEQFSTLIYKEQINDSTDNNNNIYIKDIASMLIINGGLSIDYVMNELEIVDLSYLISQIENKKKEELELQRLFSWLTVLPHVDGKKIDSPKKLLPFNWEEQERVMGDKQNIIDTRELFERFMRGDLIEITK